MRNRRRSFGRIIDETVARPNISNTLPEWTTHLTEHTRIEKPVGNAGGNWASFRTAIILDD